MTPRAAAVAVRRIAAALGVLVAVAVIGIEPSPARAASESPPIVASSPMWVWPVASARVVRPYEAPAHAYGAGHRGIDLATPDGAGVVRSPADGVVSFAGTVVDRPLVTIDHGRGYVSTLEPVADPPPPGTLVRAGERVGLLTSGGHAAPGTLHFGVRLDGEYVNPLLLLGGVPRAVLLPCC